MSILSVRTTLYAAGATEDGEPYLAEYYSIVRERPNGARAESGHTFDGCEVHTDDEGIRHFIDTRTTARQNAEAFLTDLLTGAAETEWASIAPRYGSEAWQDAAFEGGYDEEEEGY